jgi:predicted metal-dependent phosphotriesterase family hydrolase
MDEWYDNKQLYEMLQDVKSDIAVMRKEMAETRMLIRDYNGLREKVDETCERIGKVESSMTTIKWLIPIIITGMGLLFTFLNYVR